MTAEISQARAIHTLADIPEYKGVWSWVTSIDHKQIGMMYISTSLFFSLLD